MVLVLSDSFSPEESLQNSGKALELPVPLGMPPILSGRISRVTIRGLTLKSLVVCRNVDCKEDLPFEKTVKQRHPERVF